MLGPPQDQTPEMRVPARPWSSEPVGDEGKGKLTDLLAGEIRLVVRYQGGDKPGTPSWSKARAFALQLSRAGVSTTTSRPWTATGVVGDPAVLIAEIDAIGLPRALTAAASGQWQLQPDHAYHTSWNG